MKTTIKYLGILLSYACIVYLFCAYLAKDMDFHYWVEWQIAVFVTAMICFAACLYDKMKNAKPWMKNK